MKIGIFGGTFNPIHNGHLINAQFIAERFSLDEVLFIPSKLPVHKGLAGDVSAEDRYEMAVRAIAGNNLFRVSRIEIDRETPSYTITTIRHLMKDRPRDELHLIIGADSYNELETWKEYRELLSIVRIIVLARPGSNIDTGRYEGLAGNIEIAGNPLIAISSSDIRNRIRQRLSVRYLVPSEVENYINDKGLYRS